MRRGTSVAAFDRPRRSCRRAPTDWKLTYEQEAKGFMNSDVLKGKWKQLKGNVRKQWGQLTDDEVDEIAGDAEDLVGKVQERYGRSREQAEAEVDRWLQQG
jgi:uncharacterized protein YjbJ (UPF0337 family)